MLNLLNIGKLKMPAAFLAAAFVFAGCFQDPMSSAPVRSGANENVQLQLHMAVSGVDKLAKGNAITLHKLIITLTSNATPADTVRDTIWAGTQGLGTNAAVDQPISKNYGLKPLRTWKVVAMVRDTRDSVIHRDSATTPTLYAADTAAVSLNLSSRYAMYEAQFVTIPDSINSASGGLKQKLNLNRLVLKIDGVAVVDSTIPAGYFTSLQTHKLFYDYVSTSTKTAVTSGTSQHINAVHMIDANTAVVVGNGWARRTTNGGSSWNTMAFNVAPGAKILRSVHFVNATHGWIAGDSAIYRTTDGGLNWTKETSFSPSIGLRFTTVHFASTTVGTAATLGGQVYRSTDGGATWGTLNSFAFIGGAAYASNDSVGWVVGATSAGFYIRKSTNGGGSWVNQSAASVTDTLRDVFAVTRNLAIAVGNGGRVVRTTDGGTTWNAATSNTTQRLNAVWFLDATTGFAVGDNGVIISTNDGGATWTVELSPTTKRLTGISFYGGAALFTGEDGVIFTLAGPKLVEMLAYGPMGNWNTALPLFSGSKYVHAVSGVDANVSLNLSWVGPTAGTGSITATLGRVGKVTLIGTLPGTTLP